MIEKLNLQVKYKTEILVCVLDNRKNTWLLSFSDTDPACLVLIMKSIFNMFVLLFYLHHLVFNHAYCITLYLSKPAI